MLEETSQDDFEKYLNNPSNERLQKLTNAIHRFHEKRPACPHDDVYKLGTNPRKSGREQQYRCKITSIDSGKLFYNIQMITYNLFRERKFKIDDEKV